MESRVYRARIIARQALNNVKPKIKENKKETVNPVTTKTAKPKVESKESNIASKVVLCYVGKKIVAEYDSISKCATALVMSRPMVKNAIDNGTVLENGFKLVFK